MANVGERRDGRLYLRATDHGFEGTEQADYNSLPAAGRTYYDELCWFDGVSNSTAFALAKARYGQRTT